MRSIPQGTYVAPGAALVGDVTCGEKCSFWSNAVVRGDLGAIVIGDRTNVQDNAVVHASTNGTVSIGDDVIVGHGAIVHGCTVGDRTLVGMGSIVLDGAVVGSDCLIGAGALVTGGAVIPDGHVALGSPARVVREVTPEERSYFAFNAQRHVDLAAEALAGGSARFVEDVPGR